MAVHIHEHGKIRTYLVVVHQLGSALNVGVENIANEIFSGFFTVQSAGVNI